MVIGLDWSGEWGLDNCACLINVLQAPVVAAVNMDVVPPPMPLHMPALAVLAAAGTRPSVHVQVPAPVPPTRAYVLHRPAAAIIMTPPHIAQLQLTHLPDAAGCPGFVCNRVWNLDKLFELSGQVYLNYDMHMHMRLSPIGPRHTTSMHRLCHNSLLPFLGLHLGIVVLYVIHRHACLARAPSYVPRLFDLNRIH
jgi:hypothetical protein